ncbi:hypothetical protein ACKEN5_06370 [Acinetobacter baumannii]|uniref:hypothetical protein n=1 Tax=Acinetobacter baumannii TaxID=470 RepID=UPI002340B2DD|nr:hypothetical protein [Acinetobacter baumannii]MDI7715771.1 hypothetical protein [Acinetobacter baumannii]HCA5309272.1 hypothetical protein [Acinetobacter baumannii]HEN9541194.1 hypothetical protein [Acinetobacter baumannii]HEN9597595.1 hypothetical protein [Acinetobacter baumannii]
MNEDFLKKFQEYERKLSELNQKNSIESLTQITAKEKEELLKTLTEQLESKTSEEYLLKLENKIKLKLIEDSISSSFSRIKNEISSLGNRGTINLFIGITLSIGGIFYLIFTMSSTFTNIEIVAVISHLTPRILMVVFVEIFSFFFLNLYKKSLDEIKYFQNEMTNLEAKYLALALAKQSGNFKLLSSIVENLMNTERNFVLKKDETTIELEKNRIEFQTSNNTIQALKEIINFKR